MPGRAGAGSMRGGGGVPCWSLPPTAGPGPPSRGAQRPSRKCQRLSGPLSHRAGTHTNPGAILEHRPRHSTRIDAGSGSIANNRESMRNRDVARTFRIAGVEERSPRRLAVEAQVVVVLDHGRRRILCDGSWLLLGGASLCPRREVLVGAAGARRCRIGICRGGCAWACAAGTAAGGEVAVESVAG